MQDEEVSNLATEDLCRKWVDEESFRFCPEEYKAQFPRWPGMVGIEVEMCPVVSSSLGEEKAQLVPLKGDNSLSSMLAEISGNYGWKPVQKSGADRPDLAKVGLPCEDQLTFEPGGQLEYSSKPFPCLSDAQNCVESIQKKLDASFSEKGIELMQFGINPWHSVDEIGLQMDKPRYKAMNQHFLRIGPYGQRMMRQTSTIQILFRTIINMCK